MQLERRWVETVQQFRFWGCGLSGLVEGMRVIRRLAAAHRSEEEEEEEKEEAPVTYKSEDSCGESKNGNHDDNLQRSAALK